MGPRPSRKKLAKAATKTDALQETPDAAPPTAKPAPEPPAAPEPAPPKPPEPPAEPQPAVSTGPEAEAGTKEEAPEGEPGTAPSSSSTETRNQLAQRHKREVKALKEQVKRLGKKKKDEAAALEREQEARHAAEMAAWERAHPGQGEGGAGAAAAPAPQLGEGGLYAFQLNPDEASKAPKQLSRAQKRRAARDAADAEREAELTAARAAQGESDRQREAAAVAALLTPLGLALREIPADGHCMYKSLEDQLTLGLEEEEAGEEREGKKSSQAGCAAARGGGGERLQSRSRPGGGPGEGPEGEQSYTYLDLRRLAAQHLRAHREEFLPFVAEEEASEGGEASGEEREEAEGALGAGVAQEEEGEGGGAPQRLPQRPSQQAPQRPPQRQRPTPEQRFEAYCADVEATAAWGGEPELRALAAELRRRIQVIAAGVPDVHIGEEHKGPPLRLCYLRHALGAGEHYNSVVPAARLAAEAGANLREVSGDGGGSVGGSGGEEAGEGGVHAFGSQRGGGGEDA